MCFGDPNRKKNLPVYQDSNEKCQTWHPTTPFFCHSLIFFDEHSPYMNIYWISLHTSYLYMQTLGSWHYWLWKLLNEPFSKLIKPSQYQRTRKLRIVILEQFKERSAQNGHSRLWFIFAHELEPHAISGTVLSLCVFHRFWYGERRVNLTCARLGHPQWVRRTARSRFEVHRLFERFSLKI